MKAWTPNIDPATIPDDVIVRERARRNSALRVNPSGGRNGGRPQCACGACKACTRRAKIAAAGALVDRLRPEALALQAKIRRGKA